MTNDQPAEPRLFSQDQVIADERSRLGNGPYAALCLSGGGIRSATFSLGVLQGLARSGWLHKFHYLSTVSGGGYIGAWLTNWLIRAASTTSPESIDAAFDRVAGALSRSTESGPSEPPPLKHLRQHGNYLSPLMGLTTDFLALLATLIRNLLLNWVVLIPILLAVSLFPWFWIGVQTSARVAANGWLPGVATFVILVAAMWCATRSASDPSRASSRDRLTVGLIVLAALEASLLPTLPFPPYSDLWRAIGRVPEILFVVWSGVTAWVVVLRRLRSDDYGEQWTRIGGWLLIFAAAWLALHALVLWLVPHWIGVLQSVEHIRLLRLHSIQTMQSLLEQADANVDQTFLNTAYRANLEWDAAAKLAANSNSLIQRLASPTSMGVLGLVIGGTVSIIGYRSENGPRPGSERPSGILSALGAHALNIAALVFLVLLMFGGALIVTKGLIAFRRLEVSPQGQIAAMSPETSLCLLTILVGLFLSSGVAAWLIGVNEFSLYGFYRRRLKAAYVDASSQVDDEPETSIADGPPWQRPFHIVNAALNLTTPTKEYAHWQERKAASFTFSRLHAGSSETDFCDAGTYAGVTWSKAIAISGAAAAPNMGYHTSTLVSFVMTFFNVRLGAWLPNPSDRQVKNRRRSEPRQPLSLLLQELFGSSTRSSPYVYLSDGGHFENLGLYEMVRRRCRGIVVVDAGCDPDYGFEDLENAIRKIRVDLGIPIEFSEGVPTPESARGNHRHFCIGKIRYSEREGDDGSLIYIKPVLSDDEPFDVKGFASEHSQEGDFFPHQPTSNQFFTESQFESYRMLGLHSVSKDFPEPGVWSVAPVSPPADPPIPPRETGAVASSTAPQSSDASRWSDTATRLGGTNWVPFVATAAAAGALTAITITTVITNLGNTIIEAPPTDPPPPISVSAPVIAIPEITTVSVDGARARIMLPFFDEAVLCKTPEDKCKSLSFSTEEITKEIKLASVDISTSAQAAVLSRIKEALGQCIANGDRRAEEASIEIRGFASSSDYQDIPGATSQSFNLALADERAKSVKRGLGDFGHVEYWTPQPGETKSVAEAFGKMVAERAYIDRPDGAFDKVAANLTRRVDLLIDSSLLGKCSPRDLLSAARGGPPPNQP